MGFVAGIVKRQNGALTSLKTMGVFSPLADLLTIEGMGGSFQRDKKDSE